MHFLRNHDPGLVSSFLLGSESFIEGDIEMKLITVKLFIVDTSVALFFFLLCHVQPRFCYVARSKNGAPSFLKVMARDLDLLIGCLSYFETG